MDGLGLVRKGASRWEGWDEIVDFPSRGDGYSKGICGGRE